MKNNFIVDVAFTRVIREWFEQLDIEFVLIGLSSEEEAKPENILQRKFKEKEILVSFEAELGTTGNIVPKNDTCIVFDPRNVEKSTADIFYHTHQIKYFPVILCAVKTKTPKESEYFIFSKIIKAEYGEILSFKKVE